MYYYIYDTYLSDKKYEKILDQVKTKLLDLEIQGKHEKLTLMKSIDELINDEIKRGSNTVIVVGNDKTFLKVVDVIAKNGATLGMIPIDNDNAIANCLGINSPEEACDILAARKIVEFDMGQVGQQYFFSNIKINKNLDRLTVEKDSYKIVPRPNCLEVAVSNFYYPGPNEEVDKRMSKYSAQDGKVELIIKTEEKKKGWFKKGKEVSKVDTIIQGNKFEIKSFEYLPVLIDGYKIVKTPVKVELAPRKLKVIVGKNRLSSIN